MKSKLLMALAALLCFAVMASRLYREYQEAFPVAPIKLEIEQCLPE